MSEQQTEISLIEARQIEVAQYESNIAMYKSIKDLLPSEYPEHLEQYRGTPKNLQHEVISKIDDIDDLVLVSDLWTYEACVISIKTETLEMRKALAILNAMSGQ